jgi:two-component system chemotaxis response regulator CheB
LNPDKQLIDRWKHSEILLLGGSAGAFKIVFAAVRLLQPGFNKAVLIVLHRNKTNTGEMEKTLAQNTGLPLKEVSDKHTIERNAIYVAPAGYHTLVEKNGVFGMDVSDPVLYSKPSIDVTFESAADSYRDKCTAILLSGANADGTWGLLSLKQAGSLTIVQDPAEAEMPEMPIAAINASAAEYILTTRQIFNLLKT